jgi:predicted metal-binding protein
MVKAAIIRCEKNMDRCPLTNCLKCLTEQREGFAAYDACMPAGVFTCRCPGDNIVELAKILQSKGADAIHFCTCTFAKKTDKGWDAASSGFCDRIDHLIETANKATGLLCVKGTAHLPAGYHPVTWK